MPPLVVSMNQMDRPRSNRGQNKTSQILKYAALAMWRLSAVGRFVVHKYLNGGSHLQPLPGCCLALLPPQDPCVWK